MTIYTLAAGGVASTNTLYNSGTAYQRPGGAANWGAASNTLAASQVYVTNAVTASSLELILQDFIGATTGTITSNVGGSAGNITISFSSLTGPSFVADTTHSDSLSATNLFCIKGVITSNYCCIDMLSVTLGSAGSGCNWLTATWAKGYPQAFSTTTAHYLYASGDQLAPSGTLIPYTTETDAQQLVRAPGTWAGLSAYATANSTAATSTLTSRVGASAGNQTISFAGAGTGQQTDTTHTDSLSSGSLINLKIAVGDSNTLTLAYAHSEVTPSSSTFDVFAAYYGGNGSYGLPPGSYPIGGWCSGSADSYAQAKSHQAWNGTHLRAKTATNAIGTLVSRVNGSNGNQTISFIIGTSEDTTHTDSLSADTPFNTVEATSGATLYYTGMTLGPTSSTETGTSAFALGAAAFTAGGLREETASGALRLGGAAFAATVHDDTEHGALTLAGAQFAAAVTRAEIEGAAMALAGPDFDGAGAREEAASGGLALDAMVFAGSDVHQESVAPAFAVSALAIAASALDLPPAGTGRRSFWTFGS